MSLVSSLWNEEGGVFHFPVHLKGNYNLFGCTVEAFPDFRNGRQEQFLVALVQFALVFIGETLVDGAVLHVYIIDVGVFLAVIINDGEYVHVGDGVANYLALAYEIVQQQMLLL